MPHVSKRALHAETKKRIAHQFAALFSSVDGNKSRTLLRELLTSTEQVMLAKRVAIIFMLKEGRSYYYIHRTLGVSISTAMRYDAQLAGGQFASFERIYRKRTDRESIWIALEKVLSPEWASRRKRWAHIVDRANRENR